MSSSTSKRVSSSDARMSSVRSSSRRSFHDTRSWSAAAADTPLQHASAAIRQSALRVRNARPCGSIVRDLILAENAREPRGCLQVKVVADMNSRRRCFSWNVRCRAMLLAGLAGAAACGGKNAPAGDVRHVLLISLDSVRADDLTFRDADRAPNLARLAERGTVFTQAVAGSSWTLPTHVQMFTGQAPSLSRVEVDSVRIDANAPLLSEGLARAGFRTLGFWTGWYLAPTYGFGRGFELYRNAMTDGERRARELESALETGAMPAV